MKDRFYLLLTGLLIFALAWAFWHYTGNTGFEVLQLLVLVLTVADNIRLRRQLRAGSAREKTSKPAL